MINKRYFITLVFIIAMLLTFGCTSGEEVVINDNFPNNNENDMDDNEDTTVNLKVSSVVELVNNLRSNTTITLSEGIYYIDEAYDAFMESDNPNQNITWQDNFDGFGLVVFGIENLEIRADGNVTILSRSAYSYVMSFESSTNIKIDGIVFGHDTRSECAGGVISFNGCQDVAIHNSELYGSGIEGLYIESVDRFALKDSSIRECTYNFIRVIDSTELLFEDVKFMDNVYYDFMDFIILEMVSDVLFDGVEIMNNGKNIEYDDTPETSLFYAMSSKNIMLKNSVIQDNNVEYFSNSEDAVTIGEGNTIDDGQFLVGMFE